MISGAKLACRAGGSSPPLVEWFKDDLPLFPEKSAEFDFNMALPDIVGETTSELIFHSEDISQVYHYSQLDLKDLKPSK